MGVRGVWLVVLVLVLAQAPSAAAQDAARARQAFTRAVELEADGNHGAALALLWEAAGLAPRDAEIQQRLGDALDRLGALDAAIEAYRRALAIDPASRGASNGLILTLVRAGRGPEALARARAQAASSPDDPDVRFTLGLAQSDQDVEGAIESFRQVLARAPRHTLARYNLALVLKRADRLPEAIEELTRGLAIEPRAEAHYTLGVIYWHQGDLDRAIASLRAAEALQPRYADAQYTLGAVLKARRDWKGSARALRRAIALRPDLPGPHYTLAQVLQLSGDDRGARAHFEEAERLRRRSAIEQEASVWTATGTLKLDAGDASGALDHFRRAIAVFEAYAPAHYQMGRALDRIGQRAPARAAFARARALNPSLVPPGGR